VKAAKGAKADQGKAKAPLEPGRNRASNRAAAREQLAEKPKAAAGLAAW
jgi:hypothetical protein